MEIQQAIEIRRSIRAYGDRPVEREKLEADPSHPKHLLTVRGLGYRLVREAAP